MFVAWYGILVLLNVCLASTLALTYVAQARAQAWHVCARGPWCISASCTRARYYQEVQYSVPKSSHYFSAQSTVPRVHDAEMHDD